MSAARHGVIEALDYFGRSFSGLGLRRSVAIRLLGAVVVALAVLSRTTPPAPIHAADTVTFDWSVPARFGMDANGDGLIDYFTTPASISPPNWPVDFDACMIPTSAGIRDYHWQMWTVAGFVQGQAPIFDVTQLSTCTQRLSPTNEGAYIVQLTLSITFLGLPPTTTTTTYVQKVNVRDFLIVGMGDSSGSGEGNPDIDAVNLVTQEKWENERCHRSGLAGQAQAAKQLENLDSKSSVTFVHVSCSGAGIASGIMGPYAGIEPPLFAPDLPSQIDQVKALIGTRHVDAILLNIGVNDAGFGKIVIGCMLQAACDSNLAFLDPFVVGALTAACSVLSIFALPCLDFVANAALLYPFTGTSAQLFAATLPTLPGLFSSLATALDNAFNVSRARVYLAEYPDPTRDENGHFCDPAANGTNFFRTVPGLSLTEDSWAGTTVLPAINNAVSTAASNNNWTFVNGVASAFHNRGYCAAFLRAITTLDESFRVQLDYNGILHPNFNGHQIIAGRFMAFLRNTFAPVGNWTLSPSATKVEAHEDVVYKLNWTTPTVWRDLKSLDLRFRDGDETALWVRWNEADNTFQLLERANGKPGPGKVVGGHGELETPFATIQMKGSAIQGSGPTGPSVEVSFDLSFKPHAAGHEWTVAVAAADDSGGVQHFEDAGTVKVSGHRDDDRR